MKILCLALLLAGSLPAAERTTPKRVWIRRATLAASCAASLVFDTMSTRRVVSAGGVESNPLFADASGRPQWGRMIGLKAGMCGVSAIFQETHVFHAWEGPRSDWTWTAINSGMAAGYTWTSIHNRTLLNSLK